MAPVVIDVHQADDRRDVIHRAVQALAEGHLVSLATDGGYQVLASALSPAAFERLKQFPLDVELGSLALAIRSGDEALDYVPRLSPLGKRLARRCWPGAVMLACPPQLQDSALQYFPPEVTHALTAQGQLFLTVPGQKLLADVQQLLVGPVVLAKPAGAVHWGTVNELLERNGERLALVLDDGPPRTSQPPTLVRVESDRFEILRSGAVLEQSLRRWASLIIVFVCTGNTCRSPMAEILCRRMLADKLGCALEELDQRGVIVLSAGIAAMTGSRPSREAVDIMRERGLDLSAHASQPLTEQMIRQADHLLVMTRSHRQAILAEYPEAADRVRLVCHDSSDVGDPIGGPPEQYRSCAEQIDQQLRQWVEQWEV